MHQPLPPSMEDLLGRFPRQGRVEWIGIRPLRRQPLVECASVAVTLSGLEGDHARPGKRAVTLIQAEHLPVIAALAGKGTVSASTLRRNIVVSGISLVALKDRRFRIGTVMFEGTGPCAPCSRMEELLGSGGYNAMRGHGGITASVVETGHIALGDAVSAL